VPTSKTQILAISGLKKALRSHWTFKPKPILKGVSFTVPEGTIFGFLGRNGSGKTTTLKTILGLLQKDEGEILFSGKPLSGPKDRAQIGYLPELPYFYDHLSVQETMSFFAALALQQGERAIASQVKATLRLVGLEDRSKSKVKSLSKGLQQRLGLAQAIVHQPKLLILDEPFSGLDPVGRGEFREIFLKLNQEGTTILISSHILSDVQSLCHSVSILSEGVITKTFSLDERAELFGERMRLTLRTQNESPVSEITSEGVPARRITPHGVELRYTVKDREQALTGLKAAIILQEKGAVELLEYQSEPHSLEEIFLELTGGQSR